MKNFVIFEKWAVDRERWSSLITIEKALKSRGNKTEYFVPSCFSLSKPDLPDTPEDQIDGVFTWGFNYFNIQEYYKGKTDIFTVDWALLGREKGYQYILKNNSIPENKPDDRFQEMGLKPISKWNENGHILIAKQNHHLDWYKETIDKLKGITKKKIRIREFDANKHTPLKDDLKGAFALVTYNSTCLYQAVLNKIPVFCHSDCPAAPFFETDLSKINKAVKIEDPIPFLSNVTYTQFTLEEMKKGKFIDILF